ncbi:MAG: hypothetical protein IPK97_19645 [Ahniella sp.]|nr:hypothetical protein [Ahniella sp.]
MIAGTAGAASAQVLPTFPGAEGFGASTTGGRGGRVIYVTSLDPDPQGVRPGSLNWALRQTGPRYVLFQVSGVIHAPAQVVHGNVTIAGQTSPGGVIVRGLICDGHYERHDCGNLVVRHIRSRPAAQLGIPAGGDALDDALRLDGIKRFIIDRSSFAHATDEAVQLSLASEGTIQRSILGETVGGHAIYGGVLMNYAHPDFPQDELSLLKNLWFRFDGRLPEINCEASNYEDIAPFQTTACADRPLRLELSNNLQFDPGIDIQFQRNVDGNPALGPYVVHMNAVNNHVIARTGYGNALFNRDGLANTQNQLYFSGNRMNLYPAYSDYQLAYCCNDFPGAAPNTWLGGATRLPSRHPFPAVNYWSSGEMESGFAWRVGALPHDPMDRRIRSRVLSGSPALLPRSQPEANDALTRDAGTPAPLGDRDVDGMPDTFELQYAHLGLDPDVPQTNGTHLSLPLLGVAGYDNVEVYLHGLSEHVSQVQSLFGDGFEG